MRDWICCQLGAREHYGTPRALEQSGRLAALHTDFWFPPGGWPRRLGLCPRRLRDRYHEELRGASVFSLNGSALAFELNLRARKRGGWDAMMARNQWFQEKVVSLLESRASTVSGQPVLFAYSYAAREILAFARKKGWKTILGQIDPGLAEEKIVRQLHRDNPDAAPAWEEAPASYWENWRQECALADHIMVNSAWSQRALVEEGIEARKITIVPLAYEGGQRQEKRVYPAQFDANRKLRVLFLGQVNLRKGILPLLAAARLLEGEPIEFSIVGPVQVAPETLSSPANVRWLGPVARSAAADFYRQADIFLFPSLSDGFGLTQLEAQAWNLPIVASRYCGEVVQSERNGIVLDSVSGGSIAEALRALLAQPGQLQQFSENSVSSGFTLEIFRNKLLNICG